MTGIASARRLVVKVGSALVVGADGATADRAWLANFAADVAALRQRGQQVLVVSSGAWASSAAPRCRKSRPPPPRASRP
jgi:glutamate 5-kinase